MFSLTLYLGWRTRPPALPAPLSTGSQRQMNTTTNRKTANPRRTTLAHLKDATTLRTPERPEHAVDLPTQTANPRRTILMEAPVRAAAPAAE